MPTFDFPYPLFYNSFRKREVINMSQYVTNTSNKSRLVALLLCFFLGELGIHRFYVGKVGTGLLWLFTVGLFGIGWLVDLIMILVGSFRDNVGEPLRQW
jgi:TctA family transporter